MLFLEGEGSRLLLYRCVFLDASQLSVFERGVKIITEAAPTVRYLFPLPYTSHPLEHRDEAIPVVIEEVEYGQHCLLLLLLRNVFVCLMIQAIHLPYLRVFEEPVGVTVP